MSRILIPLVVLFLGWPLLSGQENERRRVIRSEALWPEFDLARHSKGIQIALQGLGRMEPVSAARVELATAVLNALFIASIFEVV